MTKNQVFCFLNAVYSVLVQCVGRWLSCQFGCVGLHHCGYDVQWATAITHMIIELSHISTHTSLKPTNLPTCCTCPVHPLRTVCSLIIALLDRSLVTLSVCFFHRLPPFLCFRVWLMHFRRKSSFIACLILLIEFGSILVAWLCTR